MSLASAGLPLMVNRFPPAAGCPWVERLVAAEAVARGEHPHVVVVHHVEDRVARVAVRVALLGVVDELHLQALIERGLYCAKVSRII
jgi:hypothetical protein